MSIPREIIQLHVGQAGIQIGDACWQIHSEEHGIGVDGSLNSNDPYGYANVLYRTVRDNKYVPRSIMVDTDTSPLDSIRKGACKQLYHPDNLINGMQGDMANNAYLALKSVDKEFRDRVLERLRMEMELCDNLQGVIVHRGLGGGVGAGFGGHLLEILSDIIPGKTIIEFLLAPSPRISSIVVENINAAIALCMSFDSASCSILYDNESIYDICDHLNVPNPSQRAINGLVAQAISSATAPIRFEGCSTTSLADIASNLVPAPDLRFLQMSYSPLNTLDSVPKLTPMLMAKQLFKPKHQFLKNNKTNGAYLATMFQWQGNIAFSEINNSIEEIKNTKSVVFSDQLPILTKIGTCDRRPVFIKGDINAPSDKAVCMLSNHSSMMDTLQRISGRFTGHIRQQLNLVEYKKVGLSEEITNKTVQIMDLLACAYMPYGKTSLALEENDEFVEDFVKEDNMQATEGVADMSSSRS